MSTTSDQLDLFTAAADAAGQCSQRLGGSGWRSTPNGGMEPVPETRCPNSAGYLARWWKADGREGVTKPLCIDCANYLANAWYRCSTMYPGTAHDRAAVEPTHPAWMEGA